MPIHPLLLNGLLLPLRLYFQPRAFRESVQALSSDLPPDYSLLQVRKRLHEANLRQGLGQLSLQALIALVWLPCILVVLVWLGLDISWSDLAVGVAGGVAVGVAFGVAGGVGSALVITHLVTFLPEAGFASLSTVLLRIQPALSPGLWRLSPCRWDEVILLPLPGLSTLLVQLYRVDPILGQEALREVAAHRYQARAARRALLLLAIDEAQGVASLAGLAAFGRSLIWRADQRFSNVLDLAALRLMREISREAQGALESDSRANRERRLSEAAAKLADLRLESGPFGAALSRWATILNEALREVERERELHEPIPQVYVIDGKPIRPASRTEAGQPFKGRAKLFETLEDALGRGMGERATLVLYGQRRSGKTSALYQLPRRLGSQIVAVFIDLQSPNLSGANSDAGLLQGLTDAIAAEVLGQCDIRLPPVDLEALTQDPYPTFGKWISTLERALENRTLLLCLDEFEALEEAITAQHIDTRFLASLRHIIQHHPQITVLLSGSHHIDELPPRWANALVTTQKLSVSSLDEKDARDLIQHPIKDFPAIYSAEAVDAIVALSRCQPYLVQLVCGTLVTRMNSQRRQPPTSLVSADDVQAVVSGVLEIGSNYFYDQWMTQTGSELARTLLRRLSASPDHYLSRTSIGQLSRDRDALEAALRVLLRREMIEPYQNGYQVTLPLMAEYVRSQDLL